MLREGEVQKVYAAVVKGAPALDAFDIREPLYKHVTPPPGERRVARARGRQGPR